METTEPTGYEVGPASAGRFSPATVIWIIGAVNVLLFGGCAGLMALSAALPPEVFQDQPRPEGVSLEDMQAAMGFMAVVLGLLIVLPGLVLIVLGVAVRSGSTGAAKAARWIILAQAFIVGLLTLINVAMELTTGNLLGVLFQLLIFGGFVALLLWGAGVLRHASPTGAAPPGYAGGSGESLEPWNDHLPR